jgi:hypothetical protein
MLSMRLVCVLGVAAMVSFAAVACTQTQAAPLQRGDDDDTPAGDDDDDKSTTTTDGGSKTTNGNSSGSTPVDAAPPIPEKSKMTFFVTSVPAGTGGNLGGLDGADKQCQDLATAVNGQDHTWHAYLSATGTNAKDRIGPGPWQNQKGIVIAKDLIALHKQDGPIKSEMLIDEKGAAVPLTGRYILTGSKLDGTPTKSNCTNWTTNQANQTVSLGDAQPEANPNLGAGWNFAKINANLNNTDTTCALPAVGLSPKTDGRIYCFATN